MTISRRNLLVLACLSWVALPATAKPHLIPPFTADPTVQKEAEKLDVEARALAKSLHTNLDGSEASIHALESLLDQLCHKGEKGQLSKVTLKKYGRTFGFYWGQVYCRHHHGTWGTVEMGGEKVPAILYSDDRANDTLHPCLWTENRLLYGDDWDMAEHYFELLKPSI